MIISASVLLEKIPNSKFQLGIGNCFSSEFLLSNFSNIYFDNIVAAWLINYASSCEELKSLFVACRELLKPGGRFFGIMPNDSVIDRTQESLEKMETQTCEVEILEKEEDFASARLKFLKPGTKEIMLEVSNTIFRKDYVKKMLEESNFEVLRQNPIEISPDIEKFNYTKDNFRAYTEEIGTAYCFLAIAK